MNPFQIEFLPEICAVYSSDRHCNYELHNGGTLIAVSGVILYVKLVPDAEVCVEIIVTGGGYLLPGNLYFSSDVTVYDIKNSFNVRHIQPHISDVTRTVQQIAAHKPS